MTGSTRLVPPVGVHDHILGPQHASCSLVEFGEYECEHTVRAQAIVKTVQHRLGDRVRFVFRHFPHRTRHLHAELAAQAAEAAADEGKFWQMHELLLARHDALEPADLRAYAREIGLDPDRLTTDLDEAIYASRVQEHFLGGIRSGVSETPTFFVNGFRYDGDVDPRHLVAALRAGSLEAPAHAW